MSKWVIFYWTLCIITPMEYQLLWCLSVIEHLSFDHYLSIVRLRKSVAIDITFLDLPRRSFESTDVRSFVRLLPAFLGIGSIVFSDFRHNDAKWQCPKSDGARFSEKYAGKTVFLTFFSRFSIFLHKDMYWQCP